MASTLADEDPTSVCDSFRAQIDEWERLRQERTTLERERDIALDRARHCAAELARADAARTRDQELIEQLRGTIQHYVAACAGQRALEDGHFACSEREEAARAVDAAMARELQLQQTVEAQAAELESARGGLAELSSARMRIAELEGERDRSRADTRDAEHRAKEQEAQVQEYTRWAAGAREDWGRKLMAHQRKSDEAHAQLQTLTAKLRQERNLNRHLQQKVGQAAVASGQLRQPTYGGGPGATVPMFRAQPRGPAGPAGASLPSSAIFGARQHP
jgi:chromosome segregation ATPase